MSTEDLNTPAPVPTASAPTPVPDHVIWPGGCRVERKSK